MLKLVLSLFILFSCHPLLAYQTGSEFCQLNPINGISRFHQITDPDFPNEKINIHSYTKNIFNPELPTLVFFTGGPGANPRGSEFFLEGFNVLFFESRGMGCSRPESASLFLNPKYYSTKKTAEDVLQILNDYKIDKAFIYGHSYGTVVASMFAHLFPERTQKLILEGVIGSGNLGIWNSERRRHNLQKTFSELPIELKEKILHYSRNNKVPKNWYSNLGTMISYIDNGYEIFKDFLANILSMEENAFISFVETFYSPKGFLHIAPEEASDGEVLFGMLTCQELKGTQPQASFYLEFDNSNELVWDHRNTTKVQYCDPLGITQEKSEYERHKIFSSEIHVPILYLVGEDDGATDLEEAIHHLKNRAKNEFAFYVLQRGGHLPNLGALKDDRVCHDNEDCKSLEAIRAQKKLFLEMLTKKAPIDLENHNSRLPLPWSLRHSSVGRYQ